MVISKFHIERVKYIGKKALGCNEKILFYSSVEDRELDVNLLKDLREHEEKALQYLQSNYKPN